jgi:heparanase 1
VDTDRAAGAVAEEFLSVSVDVAQVVGGKFWDPSGGLEIVAGGSAEVEPYDFTRPQLVALTRALEPGYLRIGGTAADEIYYDLGETPAEVAPEPFSYVLTAAQWDAVDAFAREVDSRLLFTLNAGPGTRDEAGAWTDGQARALLTHSAGRGTDVAVWSLGNEPGYFGVVHGLDVPPAQWAADHATLRTAVDELTPGARLAGPASAYWPAVGEVVPFTPAFLEQLAAGGDPPLDIVTWHYYPQQSRRCPAGNRRASPVLALLPEFLDEFDVHAGTVGQLRDEHLPDAEVWLDETGNAQCGGEPDLSDRFLAGFWWLDQLGQAARSGQQVVARQNLSGADYALLHEPELRPNPDYWTTLLWRRLLGPTVLAVTVPDSAPTLRAYAHCARDEPGGVAYVLLNLDEEAEAQVGTAALGASDGTTVQAWTLTAPDPLGRDVVLNGQPLALGADGSLPPLEPATVEGPVLTLPPLSQSFVVVPGAAPGACG